MKLISHPNVVDLKYYFFCPGERVIPLTPPQKKT